MNGFDSSNSVLDLIEAIMASPAPFGKEIKVFGDNEVNLVMIPRMIRGFFGSMNIVPAPLVMRS